MSSAQLPGIETLPTVPDGKELPYVSKSRITTFLQCPRKFFWKYWCEERSPGTIYTERGSQVHESYELFHENAIEYIEEHGEMPERFTPLLPDRRSWHQWIEYIGEFFRFELRRYEQATHEACKLDAMGPVDEPFPHLDIEKKTLEYWKPVGVEVEFWLGKPPAFWIEENGTPDYWTDEDPPVGEIPWMGYADLIVNTESIPGVDGDGVVIIDYKTGKVPKKQYRDEGIFLEGEYYGWMAENIPAFDYEIDAVAGYFPRHDELLVTPYPNQDRRDDIERAVLGMQVEPEIGNFDTDESPLCHYNNSKNHGQCWFYPVCPVMRDCDDCHADNGNHGSRYDATH
jgi:hypothetical protein